jgi:hypothetical protein
MPEQWMVRVAGREYGPVDLDTLREWKSEGRLIPQNEVSEVGTDLWIHAGDLREIFPEHAALSPALENGKAERSFGGLLAESWRVYRSGFAQSFALMLLIAVPSFCLQLAVPMLELSSTGRPATGAMVAAVVTFLSIAMLVAFWPIAIGGLQIVAAERLNGRACNFADAFRRGKFLWSRLFKLSLYVYGSYFFWTAIPAGAAFSLLAGTPSAGVLLLALLILCFIAYMVARLFINFLFWEQSGALGDLNPVEALRESRDLARSRSDRGRMQRPLFRGAILASLWLLLLIAMSIAIEFPFLLFRMRGVTNLDDAMATFQTLASAKSPDVLTILSTALSALMHAVIRPLLAACFVVLYFDTKAGRED